MTLAVRTKNLAKIFRCIFPIAQAQNTQWGRCVSVSELAPSKKYPQKSAQELPVWTTGRYNLQLIPIAKRRLFLLLALIAKQFSRFCLSHIGSPCDFVIPIADNLDIYSSGRVYI